MRSSLGRAQEPDVSAKLIQNAKRHLIKGEHDAAAVQVVTAIEIGLKRFVAKRSKERDIS
jgi:hypothetical protein